MKFLITDDSKMARKMMIKSLTQIMGEDHEILEASNGQEAVEIYKAHKPHAGFMDLTMPVMNGFDALKEICTFDSDAKIIIVSADIQEKSMSKAKENGARGFIKKPINVSALQAKLTQLGLI
jgi:CheY-like chemotaxis protein